MNEYESSAATVPRNNTSSRTRPVKRVIAVVIWGV